MSAKKATKEEQWSSVDALRTALQKKTKAELIDLIMIETIRNIRFASELEEELDITKPLSKLVTATKEAIATATDFDEKYFNHNFTIDHEAYLMVQRNFQQLIDGDHLDTALKLAVELMKSGSYQVESSDEGLMTEDIEECLEIITDEIFASKLHKGPQRKKIATWCQKMTKADRVGFIFQEQLSKLREACS